MRRFASTLLISFLFALPAFGRIVGEAPTGPPVYGNAVGEQVGPVVGSDGHDFLSFWADEREGREGLYAARFSADGILVDATDIRIPTNDTAVNRRLIAVLSVEGSWVLLWSEQIFRPEAPQPHSNVMVVRIDGDGRIIDGPRVAIPEAYPIAWRSAATNGSRIIVVYEDKYALLDESAHLLRRDLPFPVPPATSNLAGFAASNGSDFMISWTSNVGPRIDVEGIRVDANGDTIGPAARLLAAGEIPIALASDGNDYLVITQSGQTRHFSARRLTASSLAVPAPTLLPVINGIPNVTGDLIWTGTEYVFATGTTLTGPGAVHAQLFGVRLDQNGAPLDARPFPLSDPISSFRETEVAIASNGLEIASVWHSMAESSGSDTFATLVSGTSLQSSGPVLLSRSANLQTNPSLAFSGRNYLAAWQETTGTWIGRLSLDGQPLDGRGIQIARLGENPKVIFDGENYLVAWITRSSPATVSASRVSPDGEVLDPGGIPIASSSCSFEFDLLRAGDRTLVAWDDCGFNAIRVEQLDDGARPAGVPLSITPPEMSTAKPRLAWNGSEALVVFQEQIPIPTILLCPICVAFRSNIRGVRLSQNMTVLDTEPLAIAVSDSDDQRNPYTASDGDGFLVGWVGGWTSAGVRTRYLGADGTTFPVSNAAAGTLSSLIWDGFRYVLAYSNGDAFLTHAGTGDQVAISATADVESLPTLVAAGNGAVTAAYVRVATEPLYGGVPRVFLRDVVPFRMRPPRR